MICNLAYILLPLRTHVMSVRRFFTFNLCVSLLLETLHIFTASQEIPRILWSPGVHCYVYSSPPLDSVVTQINPVQAVASCFFKIRFNIILLFMPS
jgi:hypothetical protein